MKRVFFGPKECIIEKMLMDIKQSQNINYCSIDLKKRTKLFKKIFSSSKILNKLPFFVRKRFVKKSLDNCDFFDYKNEPVVFIFINTFGLFGEDNFWTFIDVLKKTFINSKFAFYYYAAVDYCYPALFSQVQKTFDLVLSFDRYSSEKYGTTFYGPINENGIVEPSDICELSDVFFSGNNLGVDKNSTLRMDLACELFSFISDKGRKCVFYLDGCTESDKEMIFKKITETASNPSGVIINGNIIKYLDSSLNFAYIPYNKSLGYLKKTKAVLEIGSPSDKGFIYTARVAQAMIAGKKLITNAAMIVKEEFYNKNNYILFDNVKDLDISRIDLPSESINYDFSGVSMVDYVEKFFVSYAVK
ncbi:MAG: hypothetical protein J5911_00880 [Clostridia bacterium]|nr:hypothetical protein [Clostridia bacterium]